MKHIRKKIAGVLPNKDIRLELAVPAGRVSGLAIFFHGCCSSPYASEATNIQLLANLLNRKRIATGFFETSRFMRISDTPEMDFKVFNRSAFLNKSFEDELADVQSAVEELLRLSAESRAKDMPLFFIGFSLGGIFATVLHQQHNPAVIVSFGTGKRFTVEEDTPIISNGFKMHESMIAQKSSIYAGHVVVVRGTEDVTANHESAHSFYKKFSKARKRSLIELHGVDHRYKLLYGKKSATILDEMLVILYSALGINS